MNAMIERLTLEELAQTLVQQSEVKQDYLVDSTRMVMEAYGGTPVLRVLDYSGGDCMEPLELTSTAHKQLGAYLKIPASYYDRMLREATDLLTNNVNNWLNRTAEVKLLRTMDGTARAVLSNRYWCVDHLNLLQMVIPVLGHMPGISVLDCGLSETRMYVKVTSERLKEDVVPGDTVQYGLIITNSEVGMGAITIQPYLYRLVCSNGMVSGERIGDGTRRIHKGCTMELNGPMQVYHPPELTLRDKFAEQFQNSVKMAAEESKFGEILDMMRRAAQANIETEELPGLLKLVGTAVGIREPEQQHVLSHLLEVGDMTLYGLANAVTRYAQDVDSYDRAIQLESAGYDLIAMPLRQWNHFNQAAALQAAA